MPAWILGGIEAEAKRMRMARLARSARDAAVAAAWKAEWARPMREWQFFRCGKIADTLARDPESLEVDAPKRNRIVRDLGEWIIRGEFDLSGESDIVVLSGEPPYSSPSGLSHPVEFLPIQRGRSCGGMPAVDISITRRFQRQRDF